LPIRSLSHATHSVLIRRTANGLISLLSLLPLYSRMDVRATGVCAPSAGGAGCDGVRGTLACGVGNSISVPVPAVCCCCVATAALPSLSVPADMIASPFHVIPIAFRKAMRPEGEVAATIGVRLCPPIEGNHRDTKNHQGIGSTVESVG
jgi:hypothetical protein